MDPTERGERVLQENPYLGVSARIVEQYARSDGQFFPATVQHVLGTLDPRIPGLGSWQQIDMANSGAITIDLSSYSFAGQPAPVTASGNASLSDRELAELLDAISETEAEGYAEPGGELSDTELEGLMHAAEADAFSDFDAAFSARAAADQDRADAIAAAQVEDILHPARRDEDRMARIISRAGQGVYDGQPAMSFAAEVSAVELAMATGQGICGSPDEFGRCASRWHSTDCAHQVSVDWSASGPPRETYDASLANFADGLALDLAPRTVWDDPDDYGQAPEYMPARTVELARSLSVEWGLDSAAPGGFTDTSGGWQDVIRPPGAPVSIQDELLADVGVELPQAERPSYPGIGQLARDLGLK